jgi:hypothetical protein
MTHQCFQPSADMLVAMEDDASGDESVLTPKSYKLRQETVRKTASSSETKYSVGNTQQVDPPLVSSYYARRRQQQQQGRQIEEKRDETPTKLSRDIDQRLRTIEESVGSRSAPDRSKEHIDLGNSDLTVQRNHAEEPV